MSSSRPDLYLDWCSHKAAAFACEHWHYAHRMYVNKMVKVGVWEGGQFIGAVVFGTGCQFLGKPYQLSPFHVCELVRVALRAHVNPVSRIVSIAIGLLRKVAPRLRLIVSFADSAQGHHGGIYQAGNWIYSGMNCYHEYEVLGERVPPRTLHNRYGKGGQSLPWLRAHVDPVARRIVTPGKHKYLMPLDPTMRSALEQVAQPYPKRGRSRENAATLPSVEGGVNPTRPLQPEEGGLNGRS